jgi:Thin aggregative fimbriae synthesis protein
MLIQFETIAWLLAFASLVPAWSLAAQSQTASGGPAARLQVWVETRPSGAGTTILLPYVKSIQATQVRFSMTAATQGRGGNSHVSQQGTINVPANEATLLARVTLGLRPQDDCRIELVLDDPVALTQLGRYSFKCQ